MTKTPVMSVIIGDSVMDDLEYMDEFNAVAVVHGFSEGNDYGWYVAMGDDMPNGLDIYNEKMLVISELACLVTRHEGESCYS